MNSHLKEILIVVGSECSSASNLADASGKQIRVSAYLKYSYASESDLVARDWTIPQQGKESFGRSSEVTLLETAQYTEKHKLTPS